MKYFVWLCSKQYAIFKTIIVTTIRDRVTWLALKLIVLFILIRLRNILIWLVAQNVLQVAETFKDIKFSGQLLKLGICRGLEVFSYYIKKQLDFVHKHYWSKHILLDVLQLLFNRPMLPNKGSKGTRILKLWFYVKAKLIC